MKPQQWWKKNPKNSDGNIKWNHLIPAGIYVIDRNWCLGSIQLESNNKTDSLITSKYLYKMLIQSLNNQQFIPLPTASSARRTFNILNAIQ